MASVNKVILVGNLGADPEIRYAASGDAICSLRIATSDHWRDKSSGENRESTEWHRVVLYRRLAEIANQYLRKGSSVYVEGALRTRKWKDKAGQDRYTTEIEANSMQMLSSPNTSENVSRRSTEPTQIQSANLQKEPWEEGVPSPSDPLDDDIYPF